MALDRQTMPGVGHNNIYHGLLHDNITFKSNHGLGMLLSQLMEHDYTLKLCVCVFINIFIRQIKYVPV